MAIQTTKQPAQPKWFTDLKAKTPATGSGQTAPAKTLSVEDRLTAVEKLLEAHGIVDRDRK